MCLKKARRKKARRKKALQLWCSQVKMVKSLCDHNTKNLFVQILGQIILWLFNFILWLLDFFLRP